MMPDIITGSVIDILSCIAEIAILLWFFSRKNERRDIGDDPVRKVIGFLPLLVLLGIYDTSQCCGQRFFA